MKNLLNIFGNFIIIFAAVVCTFGAIISAFSFSVDSTLVILIWLVTALAISLNFLFWRGKGLLILLIPALVLILGRLSEILDGARWVINFISTEYNRWLFVPIFFPEAGYHDHDLTLFFMVAGILVSFLLAVAVCMRRSTVLTILFTAPIVSLTFVLVFNMADPRFLLGLVAVYLTMLISSGLSPDNFTNRVIAMFPAFLLTVFIMSITLAIAPPSERVRGDLISSVDHGIRTIASRLGIARVKTGEGWPVMVDNRWGFNIDNVGISEAGTRIIHDIPLLEVTVNEPGIFYLRGFSMQYFDGNTWTINSEAVPGTSEDPLARGIPALIMRLYGWRNHNQPLHMAHMTISVTGDNTRNTVYTPYFSFPFRHYSDTYDFEFFNLDESILRFHERLYAYDTQRINLTHFNTVVNSPYTYLQIQDATAISLRRFAEDVGIDSSASREEIAYQVAYFITHFGQYTLAPFIIPLDEDFVMFFLETSRQGYCIHYATAATMMLRALSVPARFTTGFVVSVSPNEVNSPVVVTDRYAHAWVEVYFDDIGWLPLEVTPAASGIGLGDGRPGPGGIGPSLPPGIDLGYDDDMFLPDWMWEADYDAFTPADVSTTPAAPPPLEGSALVFRTVWIGLAVIFVILMPFAHRLIAIKIRTGRIAQEDTNAAAIFIWRYLLSLRRYNPSQSLTDGIEDIAMKARYSQYRISEEERAAMVAFSAAYAEVIYYSKSPLIRFWIKFIRGL
ncbi:MAG: DUF3488 and transglutaminase-like domain-containing protein [Oscillospiraceae bacterium]|nr:DUF3488 and transglutaminase-like domain-containing protein [Oscillospiraceae bacterium]